MSTNGPMPNFVEKHHVHLPPLMNEDDKEDAEEGGGGDKEKNKNVEDSDYGDFDPEGPVPPYFVVKKNNNNNSNNA